MLFMKRKGSIAFTTPLGRIKVALRITEFTPKSRKSSTSVKTAAPNHQVDEVVVPVAERPKPRRQKRIEPESRKSSILVNKEQTVPKPRRKSTSKSLGDKASQKENVQKDTDTRKTSKPKDAPLKENNLKSTRPSTVDVTIQQPHQCRTRGGGSNRGKATDPPKYQSRTTQSPVGEVTASTSTLPVVNRQNALTTSAPIPQNSQRPIEWETERRKLDRHHISWLDHYAGNTEHAKLDVLRRITHHIATYRTLPMEVSVKANFKSGVEKVVCGLCRREFQTVQKAATHITSEHWQLQLWTCPNGCGKSFQYQDGIKDPRKHAGGCHYSAAATSPPQSSPTGVIVPIAGAGGLSVSTYDNNYNSSPVKAIYPQNHQTDRTNPIRSERKKEKHGKETLSDMVPVLANLIGHPHSTPVGQYPTQATRPSIATSPHLAASNSRISFIQQAAGSTMGAVYGSQPGNWQSAEPSYTSATKSTYSHSGYAGEGDNWGQGLSNSHPSGHQYYAGSRSDASTSQTYRSQVHQQPAVVLSGPGSSAPHYHSQYSAAHSTPGFLPPGNILMQPIETTVYHSSSLTTPQDPGTSVYGLAAGWEGSGHSLSSHEQNAFHTTSGIGNDNGYLSYAGEAIPRSNGIQFGYSGGPVVSQSLLFGTPGRHSVADSVLPTVNGSSLRSPRDAHRHSRSGAL